MSAEEITAVVGGVLLLLRELDRMVEARARRNGRRHSRRGDR